jgi:hypothetical protein
MHVSTDCHLPFFRSLPPLFAFFFFAHAGELLADDTTQLARFEVNKNAGDVRVVGSSGLV